MIWASHGLILSRVFWAEVLLQYRGVPIVEIITLSQILVCEKEEFSLFLQLNFKHELLAPARKADLVGNLSSWRPGGPMLTDTGSFLFILCLLQCLSDSTQLAQSYMKVRLISTWLGVGYSPAPAARTAHCPALTSTFASTPDLSVPLWTSIMCYDFSIVGWLDREQIRILQSSLY